MRKNGSAGFRQEPLGLGGFLYGSEIVRRAMYGPPPVRNSPFAEYIQNPLTIRSLDDAERYIRGYIEACSSPLALQMDAKCSRIGGHIHTAEITPSGGFRWRIPLF